MGKDGGLGISIKPNEEKYIMIRVSPEFKQLCDEFEEKINKALWDVGVRIGYPNVTKIIARKIRPYIMK